MARQIAEPSFVTMALVQRGGYYAIFNEASGEWRYYSTTVEAEPRFGRNALVTKYKGPFEDGVLIMKAGVAYMVTGHQMRRGIIPMSQRGSLDAIRQALEVNPPKAAIEPECSAPATSPMQDAAPAPTPVIIERVPGTARPVESVPTVDPAEVAAGLARIRARFPELNP